MTTYPETIERPVTREEIDRLTAIIARLEARGAEADGVLNRAVEDALEHVERVRRIKDKRISRLNDLLDTDATTIRLLRHEIDVQVARASGCARCSSLAKLEQ